MKPKEKAKELVENFRMYLRANLMDDIEADEDGKQCALICVDELEKLAESVWEKLYDYHTSKYWQEVKQEIEKL